MNTAYLKNEQTSIGFQVSRVCTEPADVSRSLMCQCERTLDRGKQDPETGGLQSPTLIWIVTERRPVCALSGQDWSLLAGSWKYPAYP
jgi:hypothetical protein